VKILFVIVEARKLKCSNQVVVLSQNVIDHTSKRIVAFANLWGQNLGQRILRQHNFQVLSSGKPPYIVIVIIIEIISHRAALLAGIPDEFELVVDDSLHPLEVRSVQEPFILYEILNLVKIVLSQSLHLQLPQIAVVELLVLEKFLVVGLKHWIVATMPQSVAKHQVAQTFQLHPLETQVLVRLLVRYAHAKPIVQGYLMHVDVEVVGAEVQGMLIETY